MKEMEKESKNAGIDKSRLEGEVLPIGTMRCVYDDKNNKTALEGGSSVRGIAHWVGQDLGNTGSCDVLGSEAEISASSFSAMKKMTNMPYFIT